MYFTLIYFLFYRYIFRLNSASQSKTHLTLTIICFTFISMKELYRFIKPRLARLLKDRSAVAGVPVGIRSERRMDRPRAMEWGLKYADPMADLSGKDDRSDRITTPTRGRKRYGQRLPLSLHRDCPTLAIGRTKPPRRPLPTAAGRTKRMSYATIPWCRAADSDTKMLTEIEESVVWVETAESKR